MARSLTPRALTRTLACTRPAERRTIPHPSLEGVAIGACQAASYFPQLARPDNSARRAVPVGWRAPALRLAPDIAARTRGSCVYTRTACTRMYALHVSHLRALSTHHKASGNIRISYSLPCSRAVWFSVPQVHVPSCPVRLRAWGMFHSFLARSALLFALRLRRLIRRAATVALEPTEHRVVTRAVDVRPHRRVVLAVGLKLLAQLTAVVKGESVCARGR